MSATQAQAISRFALRSFHSWRARAPTATLISRAAHRHLSMAAAPSRSGWNAASASLLVAGVSVGAIAVLSTSMADAAAPSVNYEAVKKDIADAIDAADSKRGDGTSIGPTLVRLAWHSSGTYSKVDKTGGSNGAKMRFNPEASWGANAGLQIARDFMESIKAKHPGITYADLYTLGGVVAIENMGGPQINWRPGRTDSTDGSSSPPDGRLPDADKGTDHGTIQHIRDVFYRLGFSDREMVALIGAHAVGRCHTEASGYWGPWTRAESTFSNEYFRLLLEEEWKIKKTHAGKPWTGPLQYETKDGQLMMLPADLALVKDAEFKKYVELYAKDESAFFADFSNAFSRLLELGTPLAAPKPSWFGWLFGSK